MISIVTINYGTAQKIERLWDSLKKCSPKQDFEFIVVDNASPNGDSEKLKKFFASEKNTHVICLKKNLGFGGGYGEGVKFAKGKFLGIVNPDIEVQEGCFENLLSVLELDKNAGIVAPKLENPDGSVQENARKFPSIWVMFGRRLSLKFKWAYDFDKFWYESKKPVSVDWVQGSFMFLSLDFFKKLGGFDPRFFLFLEDTDLCRRTWNQGKKVVLVPEAKAFHGRERLSGHNFWDAIGKKTFWIHIASAVKYFWKYKFKKTPEIF